MRTRAVVLLTLCMAAGLALASSAQAAGFEITPFAGYTGGGDFSNAVTGQSLSLAESSSYGIMVGFKQAPDPKQPAGVSWVELYFSKQPTKLRVGSGLLAGDTSLDLDIEYYHIGGTYGQSDGSLQPFVAGSLGATRMVPREHGLDPETQFSLTLGGGVKWYLTQRVGLRFEGRWLGTLVSSSGGIFCSNGACLVTVQGDAFTQFTANAGIILAF